MPPALRVSLLSVGLAAALASAASARDKGERPRPLLHVVFERQPLPASARTAGAACRLKKSLGIAWEKGKPNRKGLVPVFARSVNISYTVDSRRCFSIDYYGSFIESLESFLDRGGFIPTESSPMWLKPSDKKISAFQEATADKVMRLIEQHAVEFASQLDDGSDLALADPLD